MHHPQVRIVALVLMMIFSLSTIGLASDLIPAKLESSVRIATFNTALSREKEGELQRDIEGGNLQVKRIARILRTVRPDVVLLNEFDYDPKNDLGTLFHDKYLASEIDGIKEPTISYPYRYAGPVNTGVPSGLDLDGNGKSSDPGDSWGFGKFPGQYGMLLLSRYPIQSEQVRTFQNFLWSQMPEARVPIDPKTEKPFYADSTWNQLRLSSKSHWDVPVLVNGKVLHMICSHPTPPVFDGPEDRNGKRNADEIRMLVDYVSGDPQSYLIDDQGKKGGMAQGSSFVVLGDLNADPVDGDDGGVAIGQLLSSPLISRHAPPASDGAEEAAKLQKGKNLEHKGDAANDTGDFNDRMPGNLRIDYAVPSKDLAIGASGVFWPTKQALKSVDPGLVEASDHRLVWIDIEGLSTQK